MRHLGRIGLGVLLVVGALHAAPPSVPSEMLVQFRAQAGPMHRAFVRARMGAELEDTVLAASQRRDGKGDLELLRMPPGLGPEEARGLLARFPEVEFAEPNWIYTHQAISNDPQYMSGSLWGMYGDTSPLKTNPYGSQAAEAWAKGQTGATFIHVVVIDEGIQVDHPDLAANIWVNPLDPPDGVDNDGNGYIDDIHGWDFVGNDNGVYDGGRKGNADQHGTHVAGTIGAVGGNGLGVAGVCWQMKLISAKFLGRSGGTTANAIKAVAYATDLKARHGYDIVATNNSWGGGGFSQALLDAITEGGRQGILFIAAAGNDSSNNDTTARYPANYDTSAVLGWNAVLPVASITSTGALSSFSNFGATKVALGAPGSSILSTLPPGTYGTYSGTSMATPHVTGTAALAAAVTGMRGEMLRSLILSKTLATPSLSGKTSTGGRLNAGDF